MKSFGIRVTLPEGNSMTRSHLLDDDWEYFRWFNTAEERDHAFEEMQQQPANYRKSDKLQQILNKVERI